MPTSQGRGLRAALSVLTGVALAVAVLAVLVWNGPARQIDSEALSGRVLGTPTLREALVEEATASAVADSNLPVPDLVVREATRFALSRPEADPVLSELLVAQLAANRAEATQSVRLTLDSLLEGINIPGAGLISRLGLSVDVPVEPNLDRARPNALRIAVVAAAAVAVAAIVALRPWQRDGLLFVGVGLIIAALPTGILAVALPGAAGGFEGSLASAVLYSMLRAQLQLLAGIAAVFLLLGAACLAGAAALPRS